MTTAIGFVATVGLGRQANDTAAVVVTQRQSMFSETFSTNFAQLPDLTLQGRRLGRQPNQGQQSLAGDLSVAFRYIERDALLEQFFGEYDTVNKRYNMLLSVEGKALTIAFQKTTSIWEIRGVKINQVVIAGTSEGNITLAATGIGIGIDYASVLNTTAVLDALLQNIAGDILHFDLRLRVGEYGAALTSANEYGVTDFTLTMTRPLDQVYTNQQRTPIPAVESDFGAITFDFTLPRHLSEQWQTWKSAQQRLQAELYFVNGGNSKQFIFPQLTLSTVETPISGPGALTTAISSNAYEAEDYIKSALVSFAAADNSLNITSASLVAATGTLTLTGVVIDGQTVTVGAKVFEVDTEPGSLGSQITTGNIQVDCSAGTTVQAQGTLTVDTQPTAGDTMTIGSTVYTFQANGGLTNVAGNIEIGSNLAASQLNISNAINRAGTPGTGYAAATPAHTLVTTGTFSANVLTLTARKGGTAGNAIATTETFTAGTNVFNAATLGTTTAGVDCPAAQFITTLVAVINAIVDCVVTAVDGAGDTVVVTAKVAGSEANATATTETLTNGSWGAATLAGGSGTVTRFPFAYPGATVYISGAATAGNNGRAPLVSHTPNKIIIANAGASGITLTDEVTGATVTVVERSFDAQVNEVIV